MVAHTLEIHNGVEYLSRELLLVGTELLLGGVTLLLLLFGVGGTYEELLRTGGTYVLEDETTGAS